MHVDDDLILHVCQQQSKKHRFPMIKASWDSSFQLLRWRVVPDLRIEGRPTEWNSPLGVLREAGRQKHRRE